jgi:hypothetical protein
LAPNGTKITQILYTFDDIFAEQHLSNGVGMAAKRITRKDSLIWQLLKDPRYRVTKHGQVLTRTHVHGGRNLGPWRRAGWVSPSRDGTKLYRRLQYKGEELYEHRIVWAATQGNLCPFLTVNHKDLDGCNNHPSNLELITASENSIHAFAIYRRSGMSAAEARAKWIKGTGKTRNWSGIQREKVKHATSNSHRQA